MARFSRLIILKKLKRSTNFEDHTTALAVKATRMLVLNHCYFTTKIMDLNLQNCWEKYANFSEQNILICNRHTTCSLWYCITIKTDIQIFKSGQLCRQFLMIIRCSYTGFYISRLCSQAWNMRGISIRQPIHLQTSSKHLIRLWEKIGTCQSLYDITIQVDLDMPPMIMASVWTNTHKNTHSQNSCTIHKVVQWWHLSLLSPHWFKRKSQNRLMRVSNCHMDFPFVRIISAWLLCTIRSKHGSSFCSRMQIFLH